LRAQRRVAEQQREKKARRKRRERDLGAKILALPDKRYGVIVADPEWQWERWSHETGMDRAAPNHYPTSCLEFIKSRDVQSITAKDCVSFLWVTGPINPHALAVMAAWGFDYKAHTCGAKPSLHDGGTAMPPPSSTSASRRCQMKDRASPAG
jgi:hypothetical protein